MKNNVTAAGTAKGGDHIGEVFSTQTPRTPETGIFEPDINVMLPQEATQNLVSINTSRKRKSTEDALLQDSNKIDSRQIDDPIDQGSQKSKETEKANTSIELQGGSIDNKDPSAVSTIVELNMMGKVRRRSKPEKYGEWIDKISGMEEIPLVDHGLERKKSQRRRSKPGRLKELIFNTSKSEYDIFLNKDLGEEHIADLVPPKINETVLLESGGMGNFANHNIGKVKRRRSKPERLGVVEYGNSVNSDQDFEKKSNPQRRHSEDHKLLAKPYMNEEEETTDSRRVQFLKKHSNPDLKVIQEAAVMNDATGFAKEELPKEIVKKSPNIIERR